jgi:hypothetical protein
MSTVPNPVVNASATPATPAAPITQDQVNVNMTREQIASAVPAPAVEPAAVTPPASVEPTPDNPVVTTDLGNGQLSVRYLTGETFQGTAAEVATKIGQAHVNTKNWAKSQTAQPAAPVPETPAPSPFASPEEEQTAKYVLELQAKGLGFKSVEDYREALTRIQSTTERTAGEHLSIAFAASAPEFNATAENSEKLLNTIDVLGLTPNFMSNDPTMQLNALRAAHAFALQNKIYEPKPAVQATPVIAPPPPPPPPSSGQADLSTVPEDLRVDVNMSKEEIQKRMDMARQRNYIY